MFQFIKDWLRRRKLKRALDPKRPRFLSTNVMGGRTRLRQLGGEIMMDVPPRVSVGTGTTINLVTGAVGEFPEEPEDDREEVRPVDVIQEFEADVEINIDNLDEKLRILEEKALLYSDTLKRGLPEDLEHAIEVLRARQSYPKVKHLIPWKTTTKKKIDALCKKYKLDHQSTSRFLPEFPEEVLEEIKKFNEVFERVTADALDIQPEVKLSVIAHPDLFEKVPKGDPILLAKSPFGDFYYVLCAWDKEVDYVGDLLA